VKDNKSLILKLKEDLKELDSEDLRLTYQFIKDQAILQKECDCKKTANFEKRMMLKDIIDRLESNKEVTSE